MRRLILLLLTVPQCCLPACAQAASTDSQMLQTLVKEVRELRQDFKTATLAIERAQILLYRLQQQERTVGRALQRVDDARSKFALAQTGRQNLAARIKGIEDKQGSINNSVEQKETTELVTQLKTKLAVLLTEEQEAQAKLIECEEELRVEQAKANELQNLLSQLDSALNNSGPR